MPKPFVIALLGAESTGKSTLAFELCAALRQLDQCVETVSEYLREWCDAKGRTPLQHEQATIANCQTARIAAAQGVVIADTTALMTAVYSDYVFKDESLYSSAIEAQKNYDLTLLMGLDMPWVADGSQRDGAHVRDAVDNKIRQALQSAGIASPTIYGLGPARLEVALAMVLQAMLPKRQSQRMAWKHLCECCGDGECERLLGERFIAASLLASQTPAPPQVQTTSPRQSHQS